MNHPRVSAICITDNRTHFLSRAINCFLAQDYSNKELIVAFPKDDHETAELIAKTNHSQIIALPFQTPMSLGEKRNYAIRASSGFYFCCWDDDDWSHPFRITEQVVSLQKSGKVACTLGYVLLYNSVTQQSYLSFERAWEQTLLAERQLLLNGMQYGDLNRGEDSFLVHALLDNDDVDTHINPMLYVYNFHGGNTWQQAHWDNNIFKYGKMLSLEANGLVLSLLHSESPLPVSDRLRIFVDELIQ